MINQTPDMQRINPRDLEGDDRTVYDGLTDDLVEAEGKLKNAKDNPLGRPQAQKARINQLTAKVNDAKQAIDMFLAEGNLEKYFQSGLNRNPADVVEDLDAADKKIKTGPGTPSIDDPAFTSNIEKVASNSGIDFVIAKQAAKIGARVLSVLDEEILIQGPATLAQKALNKMGMAKSAAAVGMGAAGLATYETAWFLINLGAAAMSQLQGQAKEPGGLPEMLFSEDIVMNEDGSFNNAAELEKSFRRYAKGSPSLQAWYGLGLPDPFDYLSSAIGGVKGAIGNE